MGREPDRWLGRLANYQAVFVDKHFAGKCRPALNVSLGGINNQTKSRSSKVEKTFFSVLTRGAITWLAAVFAEDEKETPCGIG